MDSHAAEYAGAMAGMTETYGTRWNDLTNTLPAVGDFVSGISCGRRWSGRVEKVSGGRITVDVCGGWINVSAADITH